MSKCTTMANELDYVVIAKCWREIFAKFRTFISIFNS